MPLAGHNEKKPPRPCRPRQPAICHDCGAVGPKSVVVLTNPRRVYCAACAVVCGILTAEEADSPERRGPIPGKE